MSTLDFAKILEVKRYSRNTIESYALSAPVGVFYHQQASTISPPRLVSHRPESRKALTPQFHKEESLTTSFESNFRCF